MIPMTLAQAAATLGIEAPGDGHFTGAGCDSRALEPGMLFVALRGERVDGHEFAGQAVAAGAAALLVERKLPVDVPQLVVDDALAAFGLLAKALRQSRDLKVAGITGSNGKTTTKEMLTNILARKDGVLATQGNHNNELGLPLTLFRLEPRHHYAVLEMGASKAGDIRYLAGIAEPDAGVITNVGPAHLQGFGDEEGVARAKGELYSSLPADGFAIINTDEPYAPLWHELAGARETLTFGRDPGADIHLLDDPVAPRVHTPAGTFELVLHLPGAHNRMNAMAAAGLAIALGVDLDHIAAGLEDTTPVPGRLNRVQAPGGWVVFDDTYNANPASLYAGLQVLVNSGGEPWLVLGDMMELGDNSRKLHAEMGEAAATLGVQRLFAIGEASLVTADAFGEGGRHFEDHEQLSRALAEELHAGVACLVKGSRSMAMERVVNEICGDARMREAG